MQENVCRLFAIRIRGVRRQAQRWEAETLLERDYDFAVHRRMFEEGQRDVTASRYKDCLGKMTCADLWTVAGAGL